MPKPTRKRRSGKAGKPRPDFPLFPHAAGYWAKKVRGKLHYFGKVAVDPKGEAALNLWLDQRDDLLAGRTPRVHPEGLTVRDLANRFLNNRRDKLGSGALAVISFRDYYATCERIVKAFGPNRLVADLDAADFERFRASMAKDWSPVTLGNEIQRVRVVFRYATENQLVPGPVRYGSSFKKPAKKLLRLARAAKGPRMFEAAELRTILDSAGAQLKAMILLGVNAGLGNTDAASLPLKALDLKAGWIDYPRPKTGIPRRCPLWPETVAALREAVATRPKPKDPEHKGLLFITRYGGKWAKAEIIAADPETGTKERTRSDDPICKEFAKLLKDLGLHRPGLGFYALRQTFETIGGDSRDQVAVDAIMGHARDDMASLSRERIDDDRLRAVVDHVHRWLWPVAGTKENK